MTSWNPMVYLRHAWSHLSTIWGKMALVLFYAFVWLTILSGAMTVVSPTSQGVSCFIDTMDEWSQTIYLYTLQGYGVFVIGFLLYADTGGLHVKNVSFVAIIITVAYSMGLRGMNVLRDVDTKHFEKHECFDPFYPAIYVWLGWIWVTLGFTWLEEKYGDSGTEAERQPLSA